MSRLAEEMQAMMAAPRSLADWVELLRRNEKDGSKKSTLAVLAQLVKVLAPAAVALTGKL